jgi:3-hydroxyacyl-[acyl-carrier-protein] dehydratase
MIDPRALRQLSLGTAEVMSLLPHRPPLLLVDHVQSVAFDPPALCASKAISPSEPVFAGHFPGRPIWPGVYTIEGLAQSCALLGVLTAARSNGEAAPAQRRTTGALLVAVDVKLTRPVFAGQTLHYLVVHTHTIDSLLRFNVEARVSEGVVARGTLTTAVLEES